MRGAERVVHVRVGELGEASREADVVRLLARIEAEVLEEDHVALLDVGAHGLGAVADDLVERHHLDLEQFAEPVGDGREPEVVPRLPLGTSEVGRHHEGRSPLAQLAEGGDRGTDPQIVRHAAAVERDVEVDADEHTGAGDVAEVVERPERH